jgi:hypothetical protein
MTLWNEDPIGKALDASMAMIMIHSAAKVDQPPANLMRSWSNVLIRVALDNSYARVLLPANALPVKIASQ